MTVLTAELTHFKLVIHLSKLKQSALRFISLFEIPAVPVVPCEPSEMHLYFVKLCRTSETSFFAAISEVTLQQYMKKDQAGTRLAGVVFFPFGFLVR